MRIGLIIYGSIHTLTGGYIYDSKLVDYLQSQQAIVKIFSQKNPNFIGSIRENFSTEIIKEILDFSPDIILQDQMNFISLFLLNRKLKKIAKCPIISIVHVLESNIRKNFFLKLFIKKFERMYLRSVDGFIFVSRATRLSVTSLIGENANFLVAYPGKDRLKSNSVKMNFSGKLYNDKLMIMFVGNLLYHKGLHVLLRALAEIEPQLWKLSVIGNLELDSNYVKKILNLIANLNLINNVRLLGLLDAEYLRMELISHHILAVPSYYESFGIVYAEAMGEGLPVIASKFGGAQEIVKHSINGFLVSPGDISEVRDAIDKLIHNPKLLKKMSSSSISSYRNMPSWDDSMKKVYAFLCRNLNIQINSKNCSD